MGTHVDFGSDDARDRLLQLFRHGQIGRCVNGVTHDINNYLGAIQAYVELLGMDGEVDDTVQHTIDKVVEAVGKSSAMLEMLTAIARKPSPTASFVDLGTLVDRTLDLKRYDCKIGGVTLETTCDEGMPSVCVDAPTLELGVLYLMLNALEALEGGDRRRITVRVSRDEDAAEIVVQNSGPVIPKQDRETIFEPFYTTKGAPHVGLGLPLARETAAIHGGSLEYDPDRGFVLRLPWESRRLAKP